MGLYLCGSCGAVSLPQEISAQAWCLVDGQTGRVLWSENGQTPLPMASTTKIMTALLAVEAGNLQREIVIPAEAEGVEGSSISLQTGERMTMEQLLQGLMMESGNDAAVAVAVLTSGSVEAFVQKMNERARELGLEQTHFENPNGLPAETHYTTAEELAKLTAYAMTLPEFAKLVGTQSAQIPYHNEEGKQRWLTNSNRLLKEYPGADGVKTGYTKAAGRCLVSSARQEEEHLICVTLNAPDDWRDHHNLLDFGFENVRWEEGIQSGEQRLCVPVTGGNQRQVQVANEGGWSGLVEENGSEVELDWQLPSFVYAPVRRGEQLGTLLIHQGDTVLAQLPLVAQSDVFTEPQKLTIFAKLRKFFNNILLLFD
ncbi:MAG: D-alanyl-D-alanine carboxypeptidase family protein [Eubacteriales bacterium]